MTEVEFDLEWTLDCNGKQDLDCDLVQLSTRYWPSSGGFMAFDTRTKEWVEGKNMGGKPSAHSSIMFGDETLIDERFDGATETEVKAKVEEWARVQIARVSKAILAEFEDKP